MATSNTFGGKAIFDANQVRSHRRHFRYEEVPELQYANSLYVAGGRWPSRGWLLLRRSDYDAIDKYATHSLVLKDFGKRTKTPANPQVTLQGLVIVQARCVTRGVEADDNAIYLVEVTDQRGVLWNQWFQFPTQSQYNIPAPAYPGEYYSASLNAGSPWSFTGMVGNLWTQMVSFLGVYPGLPTVSGSGPWGAAWGVAWGTSWGIPLWFPDGWSFPGTSCWAALNLILEYLGLTIAVNLTSASPFTIVVSGGADTVNQALFTRYGGALEDDWEYIDVGSGRVPKQVVVLFHRSNQFYGTEETVRRDSLQWSSTPLYAITITGPYAAATGTATLWADYTVQYDVDGNPSAASVAAAAVVAQTVAQNYYNRITRSTNGFMRRVYIGAIPFVVSGLVDGVCWRQDGHDRKGWLTEVVRGPNPAFPQVKHGCP